MLKAPAVRLRACPLTRPPRNSRHACRIVAFKTSQEKRTRRRENVAGDFWVDDTCIDCDTCRWMSPACFKRVENMSAVVSQPMGKEERVRAMQALLSCPTHSIHVDQRTSQELREAQAGLPAPIPGVPHIYHCGWHDVKSFAATSYLIVRPKEQGGNIMVDCPRFTPMLVRNITAMGGVSTIFLTHKDDVGDHDQWASHFQSPRVLHQLEVTPKTSMVEVQLEGPGPWTLDGRTLTPCQSLAASQTDCARQSDVELVFTPGHTEGHVCLYHSPTRSLMAGDHLSSPANVQQPQTLCVFKDFNWYDFQTQLSSVEKVLQYDWVNVLPGHGRMAFLGSVEARNLEAVRLLQHHGHTPTSHTLTG